MRRGRPIAPLSLRVEERETLERWARRPKSAQALAQRSRMVLECAAGNSNTAVAHQLEHWPHFCEAVSPLLLVANRGALQWVAALGLRQRRADDGLFLGRRDLPRPPARTRLGPQPGRPCAAVAPSPHFQLIAPSWMRREANRAVVLAPYLLDS
jgi:hypothetical protein